jgi:hypothetical protein
MKNILVISIGMILFLMLVPNSFGQTCVPAGGNINIGPTDTSFDFISNGLPSNDTCWDEQNVNFVTNTTDCGWTSNAFELAVGFSAGLAQSFTIPADDKRTHFALSYLMDFEDPNHDDFDRVVILVWDNTSGRLLSSDAYRGSLPSFSCMRHDLGTFNGSLAGHNITVQFQGSNGYANTHIRFRFIQFWGWS